MARYHLVQQEEAPEEVRAIYADALALPHDEFAGAQENTA